MKFQLQTILYAISIAIGVVIIGAGQFALFPLEIGSWVLYLEPMLILTLLMLQKNFYEYGIILGATFAVLLATFSDNATVLILITAFILGLQLIIQELLIRNQSIIASALRMNTCLITFTTVIHIILPLVSHARVMWSQIFLSMGINVALVFFAVWVSQQFFQKTSHLFYEQ